MHSRTPIVISNIEFRPKKILVSHHRSDGQNIIVIDALVRLIISGKQWKQLSEQLNDPFLIPPSLFF